MHYTRSSTAFLNTLVLGVHRIVIHGSICFVIRKIQPVVSSYRICARKITNAYRFYAASDAYFAAAGWSYG